MLSPILNVGLYNYVLTKEIVAILDYEGPAARRIMETFDRTESSFPLVVMMLTGKRKRRSLIVLRDQRFIVSFVSRKQLTSRLYGKDSGDEAETQHTEPTDRDIR